ncbi:MAG: TrbG/VirB9 family P-type conjugative transfer protein [Pseudomonadota bacterium]|nr:TrbG/VirB9 family P-type conjugative transfer protein [Pseudomonadota bacterium]
MARIPEHHCRVDGQQVCGWGQVSRGAGLPILGMALLAGWAGVAQAAIAPPPSPGAPAAHGFNFAYRSEGARGAAPTQVFDDGHRTYMQFNALDRVPELWTEDGKSRADARRIRFHLESPYVVVDDVVPRLRLVLDGEDTVLVNQAWKARVPPRAATARPRIWTDNAPFGPDDPPGPVASSRAVRPSHESGRGRSAIAAQSAPVASTGTAAAAARPMLAVSEEDADDEAAASARFTDADAAERQLAERPLSVSDPFADGRLVAMLEQARAMLARAHSSGDAELEARLRGVFEDLSVMPVTVPEQVGLADAGTTPPARTARHAPVRKRQAQGPLYALADTRPRSDVPLRDEAVADDETTAPAGQDRGPAAPATGATALPLVPAASAAGAGDAGSAAPAPVSGENAAAPRNDSLVFEVRDNQRLSQALGNFLETLGWRLEWESQSDFVVRRGYVVRAPTLKQVLLQTLGEYRLSAVLYSGNLVVAVSGGER